jgi:hypothetical protein
MNPSFPDANMTLAKSALEAFLGELAADAANESVWASAERALAHHEVKAEDDQDLSDAIELRDLDGLKTIVEEWASDKRLMLLRDRGVLKRALKAYRKRLKITVLDAESSVSGGPMSAGRASNIVGISPPERYPVEVWNELVRQKKLIDRGRGTYELAPGV